MFSALLEAFVTVESQLTARLVRIVAAGAILGEQGGDVTLVVGSSCGLRGWTVSSRRGLFGPDRLVPQDEQQAESQR